MALSDKTYAEQVIRGAYYPHIDGIRTIAVLAVVLYHLESVLCPGGFAGVDVFFVISGYLIGGGIIRDLQGGSFSLAGFYTRRIKRIMPAYFGMVVITMLAGVLLYHYEPLASLGNASLRSSYFFTNFFCYKYLGDYFAGVAEEHPLLNLWSLSVEEQFYMIVPLALMLSWKLGRRIVLGILALGCILSFVNAELLITSETERNHIKAFYLLVPRAWELLAGVLIAMAPAARTGKWQAVVAAVGFLLILGSYILLGDAGVFPGHAAVVCIMGTGLLIRYGNSGWMGKMLESALFVGIGKISYSLYLWHWPVIVYGNYICLDGLGLTGMGVAVALSFTLAYISWRYLEMPIRRNKCITCARAVGGLALVCAVVAALGALLFKSNGMVDLLHRDANQYASVEYPRKLRSPEPELGVLQMSAPDEKGKMLADVVKFLGTEGVAPDFVLIGDSHAEAMQIGLDDICSQRGCAGLAIAAKTCPLSGMEITNTFSNILEPFMEWLEKTPQVRRVLIVCRWNTRLDETSNQLLYKVGSPIPTDGRGNGALLREGLLETCRRISATGREVVLLTPVPELKISPGRELRRRIILGADTKDLGDAITLEEYTEATEKVNDILKACEENGYARIVPIHPHLLRDGLFKGVVDGKLFYHDSNHLSGDGSRYVVERIFSELFPDKTN